MGRSSSFIVSIRKYYVDRKNKQGNKRIRWFLTEAAQRAARFDPKMKVLYERISIKKGYQKALWSGPLFLGTLSPLFDGYS